MTTTDRRFFPHVTEWDGVDPTGGDIRKCLVAVGAANGGTVADFGTAGGNKTITLDPYSTRTATGTVSSLGWAVNIAGADGMDSTATEKRRIPAGTWFYQYALIAAPVASVADCTVAMQVYRVAAAPSTTRTQLFSDSANIGAVTSVLTLKTRTTPSQSEIILEPGETIQASFTLNCSSQVGGLTIELRTGATSVGDVFIDTPSPGVRTQYQESVEVTVIGTASATFGTKTVTGVVRDPNGNPVNAATVKLFNQTTDTRISTATVGADGAYTFTRTDVDTGTYYVVGFSDDTHHGTSDRGLTAT